MSSAFLRWKTKDGQSGKLRFDAVLGETHTVSSAVTTNPVEQGVDVTDNVRAELDKISLEVFVSNAPIMADSLTQYDERQGGETSFQKITVLEYKAPFSATPGAVFSAVGSAISSVGDAIFGAKKKVEGVTVLNFPVSFNGPSQVLQALRQLRDSAQIVEVITPYWDFPAMILTGFEVPRTAAEGDGIKISISLQEIRIVETKKTEEPVPTVVRGKKAKAKGAKPAIEGKGKTLAAAGADAITGALK